MQEDLPRLYTDYGIGFDVPFGQSSATLSDKSEAQIKDQYARTQTQFPPERRLICAMVVGHAEVDEGPRPDQMELSRVRASAVKSQLLALGLGESRIDSQHVGASQPIATRPSRANSRVEVELFPCR